MTPEYELISCSNRNCQTVIDVASEMLYETIAVSLFARPPTPALLAVRGFTVLCPHVTLAVTLAPLRVPRIFEQKKDGLFAAWIQGNFGRKVKNFPRLPYTHADNNANEKA